jgi:hypothetical protein
MAEERPKPELARLELNRETLQDLVEETPADLAADQAEGAGGGLIGGLLFGKVSDPSCKTQC